MKGSETPRGPALPPSVDGPCRTASPRGRRPAAVSCLPRAHTQDRKERGSWDHPQHLHSFLVCVCVVRFIRKSPYVFPLEPLCLWKCSYIQEKDMCAGLSYGQLGTVLLHVYNCLNVNYKSPCVGKVLSWKKSFYVRMLKYRYIKYCFVSAWL